MKHLRQYIRQIILSEGIRASQINNLCLCKVEIRIPHGMGMTSGHQYFLFDPKFVTAAVETHGKRLTATGHQALATNPGHATLANDPNLLASIQVMEPSEKSGECNNVGGEVKLAVARSGWGPTIYDIAMADQPNGLMPDRYEVSADAYAVWNYYRKKRNDVDKKALDWKYAEWTDDELDDCDWGSSADYYRKGRGSLDQYIYHKPDPANDDNLLPMDPIDVKTSVSFVDFLSDPLNYTYKVTSGPISQSTIAAALARGDDAVQKMVEADIPADESSWWEDLGMAFFTHELRST